MITTDHGMVYVKKPSQVVGDRETSTNIRYKTGKSLTYDEKRCLGNYESRKLFYPKEISSMQIYFAKTTSFWLIPKITTTL